MALLYMGQTEWPIRQRFHARQMSAPNIWACLCLFVVLSSLLLFSCKRSSAAPQVQARDQGQAESAEQIGNDTKDMEQLLQEPERWLNYTVAERFAMYNNALEYYEKGRHSSALNTDSGNDGLKDVYSPEIQRLDDIFLAYINTNPDDPYNSYYLYNVAGHYIKRGEEAIGLWLLRTMYQKSPDLQLAQLPSIHYLILDTIGRLEDNVDYRIDAIQRILTNFNQRNLAGSSAQDLNNERGVWLYRLGKAYETKATELLYINQEQADQQLRSAMEVYNQFFRMDSVVVPEERNARDLVASKINIYTARRNWYTDPSLESLIQKIKYAIQNNNVSAVLYYQANGFFVLSADYRDEIGRSGTKIYLPHFLGGIIQFGNLTPESNDEEAWLYSTNWPFHLTTWYLYFHKIHYPADPKIDGNWEWAGIYLGDFY